MARLDAPRASITTTMRSRPGALSDSSVAIPRSTCAKHRGFKMLISEARSRRGALSDSSVAIPRSTCAPSQPTSHEIRLYMQDVPSKDTI